MNLTLDYTLDAALMNSLPVTASRGGTLSFTLMQFLSCIGTLTTLSYPAEFDLARLHAFVRYAWLLAGPGSLRLRDSVAEVDFHQKTLISDELGVGVSGLVASQVFGVQYFADAFPFLRRNTWIATAGAGGRTKTPDFIGLDSSGNFFVIESKGSQSGNAVVNKQVKSGRVQKANVNFSGGIQPVRMVVATRFTRESHRIASYTQAFDPEPAIKFSDEDREIVRREHFLKVISSAGVRIRRNELLGNNYSFDKTECIPIEILGQEGLGTSFSFYSDTPIGSKKSTPISPCRYTVSMGVSKNTFIKLQKNHLPELAQKTSIEHDMEKQIFSLLRDDGWMIDIRILR